MKNFKSLCLISFLLTTLVSCSEKSKTPTEFNMTLGGLSAVVASDFAGGIILTGSNGSENFRVGVTPNNVDSFSMELPSGDWNFTAIGWLNDASEGPMTGQARCGFASSKIESADATISMNLSQANCIEGKIADSSVTDPSMGSGLWFKKIDLISCLNPDGITAGDLCDGPELKRLPGEAAAVRIVFPGQSSFGPQVTSLRSRCYPNDAVTTGEFTSGLIPTSLRLPFLGSQKWPWAIETFDDVNCQKYETTYAMPDGLTGTQGVYRLVDPTPNDHIKIHFADNYIGKVGSLFDDAALSDILPSFACANNCYPGQSPSPSGWGGAKDDIRDQIWQELGNAEGLDSNDIIAENRATGTITDPGLTAGVTVYAPEGSGSAGNNIQFSIQDNFESGDPVNAHCDQRSVTVNFDSAAVPDHTDSDMAAAIMSACAGMGYEAVATTAGTAVTFDIATSINLAGGTSTTAPTRKKEGNIQSIKRMLYGPIGIGLKSKGVATYENLCDGSMDGIYEFNIPAGRVKMQLTDPTPNAILPDFATYSRSVFQRKIVLEVDGDIEEAFYFNCDTEQTVGAHLSYEYKNSSYTVKQSYWDTTTINEEWLETASQQVNQNTNELLSQSSFIVKFLTATQWDAWLMRYHHSDDETVKAVGRTEMGTLYAQKTSLNDGHAEYNNEGFSLQAEDQLWEVATGNYSGTTATLYTPSSPPTSSNIYPSYSASNFEVMMNGDFWDYYNF